MPRNAILFDHSELRLRRMPYTAAMLDKHKKHSIFLITFYNIPTVVPFLNYIKVSVITKFIGEHLTKIKEFLNSTMCQIKFDIYLYYECQSNEFTPGYDHNTQTRINWILLFNRI